MSTLFCRTLLLGFSLFLAGMGLFRRHPSESHNDLYPEVHATLSSEYLALLVGKKAISALDKQGASLGGLQLRRSPLLASCIRS